jgi:RHS repeat-associated protein
MNPKPSTKFRTARGSVFLLLLVSSLATAQPMVSAGATAVGKRARNRTIPLYFEKNVGQTDAHVQFLSRGRGYRLFLTSTGAVLKLSAKERAEKDSKPFAPHTRARSLNATKHTVVRLAFQGTKMGTKLLGLDELQGKANYLFGSDPTKWYTDVPLFTKVLYQQLYDGVDAIYYGTKGRLEYDLLLSPQTNPNTIRFRVDGSDGLKLTESGDLQLSTSVGTVLLRKPAMYQVDEGGRKRSISGGYVVRENHEIGITVVSYDKAKRLVVDPVLEYSTYVGGTGQEGADGGVGVDGDGNVYVDGTTTSSDFPATSSIGTVKGNGSDTLFVTKLDPTGTSVVYATYIGGTGNNVHGLNGPVEPAAGIAVDANGFVYIAGITAASDFPVTSTAFQPNLATGAAEDGFVVKLSPNGQSLAYSSYLGGNADNYLIASTIDANQNVYLAGYTSATSPAFPVTSGAFQTVGNGPPYTAFVSKIDTTKTGAASLAYSSLLGGSAFTGAFGIAADSAGKIYVTGQTTSTDFPVTGSAYQGTGGNPPYGNVFLSELDPSQSGAASLVYSTYFGGTGVNPYGDYGYAVQVDSSGKVHIGGWSESVGFPTTISGTGQAFIAEFDTTLANAASLIYSRCFGSPWVPSFVSTMAIDSNGNTYAGGATQDTAFPLTPDAVQSSDTAAAGSGFLTVFSPDASTILYSTYFGSSDLQNNGTYIAGLALDPENNIYITGFAAGVDLPTTQVVFQPTLQGATDVFVAKFGGISTPTITGLSASSGLVGTSVTIGGVNFGSSQGTVTFNGVAATPTNWSPNSITVPVPAGATTGNVVVTVAGIPSNGVNFVVLTPGNPITLVQHTSKDGSTTASSTLAFASNNSAGNWIGVCIRAGAADETFTVTDSLGNTYRQALWVNETGSGNTLAIFYAENIAPGANTITVSDTASAPLRFAALEYAGVATVNSLDVVASAIGNSTTPNSGNATTTGNGDLLLGAILSANGATYAAGTDYTAEEYVPTAPNTTLIVEDSRQSLDGPAVASATLAASDFWAAALASFRPASAGVGVAPTITGLNPETGTSGTVVTIAGSNFGATQGTSTVKFNGITATPTSWGAGSIAVPAPTGVTTGYVVVTVGGIASNGVTFAVTSGGGGGGPHPWSHVQSTARNAGGRRNALAFGSANLAGDLIIAEVDWPSGSNFTSISDSRGNTYIQIGTEHTSTGVGIKSRLYYAKNIAAGSNTVTTVVSGFPAYHELYLHEYSGVDTSNPLDSFSENANNGTSFTSGNLTTTGNNELLYGVEIDSSQAAAASGWTTRSTLDGNVAAEMNASAPGNYAFTGTSSGSFLAWVAAFKAMGGPSITSLSPTSGTTGTSVTITGTNFGSTQGSSTVTFNGTNATPTSWSTTQIKAPVPNGASSGNVVVTVGGQSSTGTHTFTVSGTPTISGMSPNMGGVGTAVTITGSNLGSTGTVTFNGVTATPWSWSPTLIVVPAPAVSGSVVVTVGGQQLPTAGNFELRSNVPSTATEFSYDQMGRVVQKTVCTPMNCGTGQPPPSMFIGYDLAGDMTSISFYGTTITYGIDAAGRVAQVTSNLVDAQHPATLATVDPSNGYWPTGAIEKVTFGNNLAESAVYNNRVQPCRINVNSSGTLLSSCSDALPSGNVQDFRLNFGAGGGNNGNVGEFAAAGQQNFDRSYSYDSLNRIQTMSAPGDQCSGLSWTIDPWGNRTAQTATGGSCFSPNVNVDTNNHLTPQNCSAPNGYCYDAGGNLTNDGLHTYTYDGENRITQVDGGATASYVYDAFGNRVEKTAGSDSQYVYDNAGRLNTVFSNGSFDRMYVYLEGQQLAEYFENTTYFIHSDNLDSTRLLTRLDQSVRESDDYYPYGEQIPPSGGNGSLLKFTGKERDSESGLDNFGKRYNASSLGRFMTPDPIMIMKQKLRDPQQWNMYSYTRNNPVSFTDPTGAYTCQGNKDQCAQIKSGYDAAQKALAAAKPKSEQAKQLQSVLKFLGKPGEANGVAVTFGKLDTGTPAQTTTQTTRDLLGTNHTTTEIKFDLQQLNPDVRLTSGHPLQPLDNDTGAVLVHEGTHGRDDLAQGHDPQSRAEALRTERNAYRNEGYVYDMLGVPSYVNPSLTAPGANRDQTIERLANDSADASGW